MILIADSGTTKTDWALIRNTDSVKHMRMKGINPFSMAQSEIEEEMNESLSPLLSKNEAVEAVYFYVTGCNPSNIIKILNALTNQFPYAKAVEAHSDLLAAARALCNNKKGIACILGAGSNSCLYDGKSIISNVSPLGYVLGDEGSGAVLGKLFVSSLLKNQLSTELKSTFFEKMKLDESLILDRVYRQPYPNNFLASLCPFILKHISDKSVYDLVYNSFYEFVVRNVMQYNDYETLSINFIGSVAFHFKNVLINVLSDLSLHVGKIEKSPIRGLMKYHIK